MKMIVFDLDGTLVDTVYDIGNSMNMALEFFGLPTHKLDMYYKFIGKGVVNLTRCAINNNEVSDEFLYQVLDKYNEIYPENCTNLSSPYNNITYVLDELISKGYTLGVISNKPDKDTKYVINHYFPNRFTYVAGAKPDVERKPSKEAMEILMKHLNVEISDITYVGDSRFDAEFAINSGCRYFLFEYGYETKENLHSYQPVAFLQNALDLLTYF